MGIICELSQGTAFSLCENTASAAVVNVDLQ